MRLTKPNFIAYSTELLALGLLVVLVISMAVYHDKMSPGTFGILEWPATFVIHILTLLGCYRIYKNLTPSGSKTFNLLFLANIGLFFVDALFYYNVYFQHKYVLSASALTLILGYVPYFIFLFSLIGFLSKILSNRVFGLKRFLKILPLFCVINIFIIGLFLSAIDYQFKLISWQSGSHIFSLIIEFIAVDLALTCLIYTENKGLSIVLCGFILLISGDFFVNDSFLSQTISLLLYGQILWFFGLFVILIGTWVISQTKPTSLQDWCSKTNRIKNQLALWSFGTSTLSFLLFFLIAYCFSMVNTQICLGLPVFVMGYSIVVVLISIFMGRRFETPFQKIAENVSALMNNDKSKIDGNFATAEFLFLQTIITNAFQFKEEKEEANRQLAQMSYQLAHDLKSPIAALHVLDGLSLPEEDRLTLRNAIHTIQDIANNIGALQQIDHPMSKNHPQQLLISGLILTVISEKRLQYNNTNIQFECQFMPGSHFSCIKGNQTNFVRMLSNLINNAVDACKKDTGKILLTLNFSEHNITVSIKDNGKGMPLPLITRILREESVTMDKKHGHGIGLRQVRQTLKQYKGRMDIESIINEGTEIILTFPRLDTPRWLANKIEIEPEAKILILDDDTAIHLAWDQRLKKIVEENKLEVLHFTEGAALISYIATLNSVEKERLFLLTDYELVKQNVNGLDILAFAKIKNAILVTSHDTNLNIIKRAALLGARILPKFLVRETPIALKAQSEKMLPAPVDIIIVDDKPQFMEIVIKHQLHNYKVKYYSDPYLFIADYAGHAKETPICLDNDFGIEEFNGQDLAVQLHKDGFQNLYLISGSRFADLPQYLTAIGKHEMQKVLHKRFSIPSLSASSFT